MAGSVKVGGDFPSVADAPTDEVRDVQHRLSRRLVAYWGTPAAAETLIQLDPFDFYLFLHRAWQFAEELPVLRNEPVSLRTYPSSYPALAKESVEQLLREVPNPGQSSEMQHQIRLRLREQVARDQILLLRAASIPEALDITWLDSLSAPAIGLRRNLEHLYAGCQPVPCVARIEPPRFLGVVRLVDHATALMVACRFRSR
jgi:hypothetical protein